MIFLVGTDFSPRADRALRRATILARQLDAELLVAGVIEHETKHPGWDDESDPARSLENLARKIADRDGIRCSVELRRGRPANELADLARSAGVALLVIGPHRRSMIRDAFGAVTAERIVRDSPVPLLVSNKDPEGPYRRMLIPVNLDDGSRKVIEALTALGLTGGARITLLHVYDAAASAMLGRAMVPGDDRTAYLSECASTAQENLREFAASVGLERAALRTEEGTGLTAEIIERFAEEERTDLVVLARSQKGAIAKTILGSVTHDVLRAGKRDVMVFPELG